MDNEDRGVTGQNLRQQQEQCQDIRTDFENSPGKSESAWSRYRRCMFYTAAEALTGIILMSIVWWLVTLNTIRVEEIRIGEHWDLAVLIILYMTSIVAGQVTTVICNLPPMIGMLLAGIAFGNCGPSLNDSYTVDMFYFFISESATFVIMIISVLELNVWEFRRISGALVRLVAIPLIVEIVLIGVVAHYIWPYDTWKPLYGYGFVWSTVSPAVLVPSLLRLKRMGYGEKSGIINLLIAASSIAEVITSISDGFLLCLDYCYASTIFIKICLYAEDLFVEIGIGIIFGVIMIFEPSPTWIKSYNIPDKRINDNQDINKKQNIVSLISIIRAALLFVVGFLIGLFKWHTDFPTTWSLGCAISSFVASTGWKYKDRNNNNPTLSANDIKNQVQDEVNAVSKIFEYSWNVLHPLIFGLIGMELNYECFTNKNHDIVFTGIIIITVVIVTRVIVTTCSVWGTGFNYNEVIFINIAWIVNSTIMACLATTSHLYVQRTLDDFYDQIIFISVIFLLLRAFLGSFAIQWFGPSLLT